MALLALRSNIAVLPQSSSRDDVLLYRAAGASLRVRKSGLDVLGLVEQIQDGVDSADLLSRAEASTERAWLSDLIGRLDRGGYLASELDADKISSSRRARFERLLSYFSAFETEDASRFTYLSRLLSSRVAVVGLGSLGSWATFHLASNAVGEIHGIDNDVVELSNLSRQILYRTEDVGLLKVQAAQRTIESYSDVSQFTGHASRVDSAAEAVKLLSSINPDVVLLSADSPRLRIGPWFSQASRDCDIPLLRVNALGVGPLRVDADSACSECHWGGATNEMPNIQSMLGYLTTHEETGLLRGPVYSPIVGMYASLASNEIVNHLTGMRPPTTLNARLSFDPDTSQVTRRPVYKDPDCAACGAVSVNV